ncbi:MAG: hypothetical protein CL609_13230 [Anaerolineaceae bacterium]|nr:hypothetical protein [Anaerolineaceae bacterium]
MKKALSLLAVIMILSLILTACTPTPNSPQANEPNSEAAPVEEPVANEPVSEEVQTIRVMTFFAYDNPEVEKEVVAQFEAAHPNIKVELELVPFVDIFTKYKTLSAGGSAPDVISMNFENLRQFATLGALEPLGDYIAKDSYDMSTYYENTNEMHNVDGTQFGLPATFSNWVLYYNKTMFDEKGIEYPSASWDWAKMVEEGQKFVSDDDGDGIVDTYGYGLAWWPMYLFMYDTNVLTPDNASCALTSPGALQAIENYVKAQNEDGITANKEAQTAMGDWDRFVAGKLAMFPSGPWALKPFNDSITTFEWDVTHHPIGTQQGTFLYSNSYAISSGSKNKDAAWEFLKFATGPEGSLIRQKGNFEISAVKEIAEGEFIKSLEGQYPAHPEVFMEATSYGQKLPDHARLSEILDTIQAELDLAVLGDKSVEQAMTDACVAVDSLLSE